MKLRWQSPRCTRAGLRLMEAAVRSVEERLETPMAASVENESHIPTAINDALYKDCLAVAVTPNASEGCCFRGMECTQFELRGKVFNIAIILRPSARDAFTERFNESQQPSQSLSSRNDG